MKTYYKILLFGLLFTTVNNLNAQNFQDDSLKFSGRISVPVGMKKCDKILIGYNKIDWFTDPNAEYLRTTIDKSGNFKFKLPNLNKPYKINFFIYNTDKEIAWNYLFYLEAKDNVKIEILKKQDNYSHFKDKTDSTSFSGVGSEKYDLALRIQQNWKLYWQELELISTESPVKDANDMNLKLESLVKLLRKFRAKKASLIEASSTSPKMKTILNYEPGEYDYNSDWVFRLTRLLEINPNYNTQIKENYNKYRDEFYEKPNFLVQYCASYAESLVKKNILELMLVENSNSINLKSLHERLKENYSGVVLDRVIGVSLLDKIVDTKYQPYTYSLMDSIVKDGVRFVDLPYVKKALISKTEKLKKIIPGVQVYDTDFIDLNGNKFQLNSLRGKVVLIDMWFNGCTGCANFHAGFDSEIYPAFKTNKDFVVLSVSMDKTKELWLKGIASENYTSEKNINVWTGNGIEHPFLKYYEIYGGPWLMVIGSNGKIFYQPNGGTAEELTSKIALALNSMNNNLFK